MGALQKVAEGGEVQDLSGGLLEVIARAARDPNVDIDKMERLLAMQERVLQRDAEMAFNQALKAAKEEMPIIFKDGRNSTTNSSYSKLETLSAKMDPIITKHGFVVSFGTGESHLENHYRVTGTLSHDAGHSREYFADVPADTTGMKGTQNKTATHGFGSTMSYGRRYLKMLIFDIALTDDDGVAAESLFINPAQLAELEKVIADVGADRDKFLDYAGVNTLADIYARDFRKALSALRQKAAKA